MVKSMQTVGCFTSPHRPTMHPDARPQNKSGMGFPPSKDLV